MWKAPVGWCWKTPELKIITHSCLQARTTATSACFGRIQYWLGQRTSWQWEDCPGNLSWPYGCCVSSLVFLKRHKHNEISPPTHKHNTQYWGFFKCLWETLIVIYHKALQRVQLMAKGVATYRGAGNIPWPTVWGDDCSKGWGQVGIVIRHWLSSWLLWRTSRLSWSLGLSWWWGRSWWLCWNGHQTRQFLVTFQMGNCREPRGEAEQQLGAAAEAGEVEGLLGGGQVWVRGG